MSEVAGTVRSLFESVDVAIRENGAAIRELVEEGERYPDIKPIPPDPRQDFEETAREMCDWILRVFSLPAHVVYGGETTTSTAPVTKIRRVTHDGKELTPCEGRCEPRETKFDTTGSIGNDVVPGISFRRGRFELVGADVVVHPEGEVPFRARVVSVGPDDSYQFKSNEPLTMTVETLTAGPCPGCGHPDGIPSNTIWADEKENTCWTCGRPKSPEPVEPPTADKPACECGAAKANTPHSTWCPAR